MQSYGIGADKVDSLIQKQGGLCAVCLKRPATQVDHDHTTGVVRGIVCLLCNAAMGAFRDDPKLIRRAIAYVREHSDD
jgi:Recombination endonuclease VII